MFSIIVAHNLFAEFGVFSFMIYGVHNPSELFFNG